MKEITRIQQALMYANQDFRYWARQDGLLTRDEFAAKKRAETHVRALENELSRALART